MLAHTCTDCPTCDAARVAALRAPAEVWCRRCTEPSAEVVNGEAYCHEHALEAHWKANSPSWNPERTTEPGHRFQPDRANRTRCDVCARGVNTAAHTRGAHK